VGFAFSRGHDPRWTWYADLLRGTGALDDLPEPVAYAGVREPGVLLGLLEAAGFVDVHEHTEITDVWYASPEAWWTSLWTHGSRRPLERMPAEVLADFQLAAMARVRAMVERRGVLEQMQLVYVVGRGG
jgi:hypothetical protein